MARCSGTNSAANGNSSPGGTSSRNTSYIRSREVPSSNHMIALISCPISSWRSSEPSAGAEPSSVADTEAGLGTSESASPQPADTTTIRDTNTAYLTNSILQSHRPARRSSPKLSATRRRAGFEGRGSRVNRAGCMHPVVTGLRCRGRGRGRGPGRSVEGLDRSTGAGVGRGCIWPGRFGRGVGRVGGVEGLVGGA
jgi:hypothetical protein